MAAVHKKNNVNNKPICKYGSKCYRKNSDHLQNFSHPKKEEEKPNPNETKAKCNNSASKNKKRTIEDFFEGSNKSHDLVKSDDDAESNESKKLKPGSPSCPANSEKDVAPESVASVVHDVPPSPEDVKEILKRKFLVEMPDDFYSFWEFCKSLNPKDPSSALAKSLNIHLVGPFDILCNKHKGVTKNKHGRTPNYLLHYRYFYDPPEFQTVLTTKDATKLHFGYYRDDPKEFPVFVASNAPGESPKEKICQCGENLFAAVLNHASKLIKTSSTEKKKLLENLMKSIELEAGKLDIPVAVNTKRIKDRQKKVVCPTFHGAGIVVPVDDNEVGYRPVPETPASLRAMLKKIVESKTEAERDKSFDDLQEIITYIQFANDECDYGEGLELGLDLFSFGSTIFHPQIATLLPLAYQLLNRPEFSKIIEAHLKYRRDVSECVDELAL